MESAKHPYLQTSDLTAEDVKRRDEIRLRLERGIAAKREGKQRLERRSRITLAVGAAKAKGLTSTSDYVDDVEAFDETYFPATSSTTAGRCPICQTDLHPQESRAFHQDTRLHILNRDEAFQSVKQDLEKQARLEAEAQNMGFSAREQPGAPPAGAPQDEVEAYFAELAEMDTQLLRPTDHDPELWECSLCSLQEVRNAEVHRSTVCHQQLRAVRFRAEQKATNAAAYSALVMSWPGAPQKTETCHAVATTEDEKEEKEEENESPHEARVAAYMAKLAMLDDEFVVLNRGSCERPSWTLRCSLCSVEFGTSAANRTDHVQTLNHAERRGKVFTERWGPKGTGIE